MNSFGTVFEAFAERYDLCTIRPNEALITNDPYSGGQHLNDFVLFTPIFAGGARGLQRQHRPPHRRRRRRGGTERACDRGDSEGLRIPLLRFDLERDLGAGMLEQIIRVNVRPPDLVMGDVYAQIAANNTGRTACSR